MKILPNKSFDRVLPKWPGLLVVGEPVTKEQAMEIIIRTDGLDFISNDHHFVTQLNTVVLGLPVDGFSVKEDVENLLGKKFNDYWEWSEWITKKREPYKLIGGIYYLKNHQITDSWIGGTHGWCNWDGKIFCNTYNIGKHPSVEEVHEEWIIIAKGFPYLNLKSQLLNAEHCQEEYKIGPVVQFDIKNGEVKVNNKPNRLIAKSQDIDFTNRFDMGGERGCTIERFTEALMFVKNKYENTTP